jgi:hypothetical protein
VLVGTRLAGHIARQPLLAVKTAARGHHDWAVWMEMERAPHGLLDALGAAGRPEHFLGLGRPHALDQTLGRFDLDGRDHIVGVQGQSSPVLTSKFLEEWMGMSQISHQHTGGKIDQLAAIHRPDTATLGPLDHQLRRRIGAQTAPLDLVQPPPDGITLGFPRMMNRRCHERSPRYCFGQM